MNGLGGGGGNHLGAATLNDIPPSLGSSVGLPDNLLAFVLRHLRCVGTIEKFSLCNIKVPLMRGRPTSNVRRRRFFFRNFSSTVEPIDTLHMPRAFVAIDQFVCQHFLKTEETKRDSFRCRSRYQECR